MGLSCGRQGYGAAECQGTGLGPLAHIVRGKQQLFKRMNSTGARAPPALVMMLWKAVEETTYCSDNSSADNYLIH